MNTPNLLKKWWGCSEITLLLKLHFNCSIYVQLQMRLWNILILFLELESD